MSEEVFGANLKVLKECKVSPPPGSVPSTSVPLTFFDIPWLLCPPIQRIFIYNFPNSTHHFLQTFLPSLQHSLSLALSHFFPFSAKLISHSDPPHLLYLDSHDSVSFTVAESTADFSLLAAHHPRPVHQLRRFLPELPPASVMAIQVTVIPHSGFTIGINFRHVAADGRSFHHFIKSWASICRTGKYLEEEEGSKASYNRDEIVRQWSQQLELKLLEDWRESGKHTDPCGAQIPEDMVRATVLLGRAQIDSLKKRALVDHDATFISSFVVTCGLIWSCIVKSEEEDNINSGKKDCYLVMVADCRGEMSIPRGYFGNCLAIHVVKMKRRELVGESGMWEAVKGIGKKVKEMKEEGGLLRGASRWIEEWNDVEEKNTSLVTVAGSPRLGVYQTDFGVGRPTNTEVGHVDRGGVISIAETRDEQGGIEVGLALPNLQMHNFQSIFNHILHQNLV